MKLRQIKAMHLLLFNNESQPNSHPTCEPSPPPAEKTQAIMRIERYFDDYKSQIKNSLAGIGQPKKRGNRDRM